MSSIDMINRLLIALMSTLVLHLNEKRKGNRRESVFCQRTTVKTPQKELFIWYMLLFNIPTEYLYSKKAMCELWYAFTLSYVLILKDNVKKLAAECQSAGYPGILIPYKCDLSNEEEILSMFSAIKTLHQGVDVCINNAGLARPEPLLSGKTEGWRMMIDVNVMAVSICTREVYRSMKERNIDDGHIININSMNGHSVVPQSVVHFYSATKYAVTALTEGLRQELREAKTHIRATCISPGLVETGFAFKLHDNDPERAAATYESIRCLKAEDMANAVIYVLSAPPHVQSKRDFFKLFLKSGSSCARPVMEEFAQRAKACGVPVHHVRRQVLDALCKGKVHQGVCLEATPLHFRSLEEAEASHVGVATGLGTQLIWLVLEQIQDPMNLGAVLRSAHFLGVDRVVTSQKDSCPLTPTVSKASAGAMEVLEVYSTDNLQRFLKAKTEEGWEVIGTVSKSEVEDKVPVISCLEFHWNKPTVLVLGNEGYGLSSETQSLCHRMLIIPPGRTLQPGIESLNVSVATGKNNLIAQTDCNSCFFKDKNFQDEFLLMMPFCFFAGILLHSICSQKIK
ncbi:Dehydrogenase/reductase SDR family member 11 [Chelonia mydas]|uniref:Dehydrogenase/reductase SDR family member 11 n=1 Tax=Chelonia mydas TaxID=8469 RepID=M7BPS3_CHEMY|nr:Dehydrogenase/reductase SDR family member 11 [Chelonia mydas]